MTDPPSRRVGGGREHPTNKPRRARSTGRSAHRRSSAGINSARSAGNRKGVPGKNTPANTGRQGAVTRRAKPNAPKRPDQRSLRSGLFVRAALIIATVTVGVLITVYPANTWLDQRQELEEVRAQQTELLKQIEETNDQIALLSGPEGIELRARCVGPYVRPGAEAYLITALNSCTEQP